MVADGRDGPECQNGGREVREGGGGNRRGWDEAVAALSQEKRAT